MEWVLNRRLSHARVDLDGGGPRRGSRVPCSRGVCPGAWRRPAAHVPPNATLSVRALAPLPRGSPTAISPIPTTPRDRFGTPYSTPGRRRRCLRPGPRQGRPLAVSRNADGGRCCLQMDTASSATSCPSAAGVVANAKRLSSVALAMRRAPAAGAWRCGACRRRRRAVGRAAAVAEAAAAAAAWAMGAGMGAPCGRTLTRTMGSRWLGAWGPPHHRRRGCLGCSRPRRRAG